jgi:trk system potassium uptake protein TrkH
MKTRLRAKPVGLLLIRFAPALLLLLVPPLLVAALRGEGSVAWPLLGAVIPCAAAAIWLERDPPRSDQTAFEAVLAVTILFPVAGLLLTPAFFFNGLGFTDSLFDGISSVTSTGLSRYSAPEDLSFSVLFMRAWFEWVGGYAIITLTVAFLSASLPATSDIGGVDVDSDDGDMKKAAFRVLLLYCALTVLSVVALALSGAGWRDGLLFGLATISTGGFAPHQDSVQVLSFFSSWVVMVFMLLGAVTFSDLAPPDTKWRMRLIKLGAVVIALMALGLVSTLTIAIMDGVPFFDALFTGFSGQTTTGFSRTATDELGAASKLMLTLSMFIGADTGSTGGGIKILRLLLLTALVLGLFRRARKELWPDGSVTMTLSIIAVSAGLILAGALALSLLGSSFVDALFEMTSAVSTVGLSSGITADPPHPLSLWVLMIGMSLGRVEVLLFALMVANAVRGQKEAS